jgi:hypothetical protein
MGRLTASDDQGRRQGKDDPVKKLLTGVAVVALLAASAAIPLNPIDPVTPALAQQADVSIKIFFDRLNDSGRWVAHPRYHYVWVPTKVAADWRPYSHGHWVYTERYGWYFVSDEPFAWAVYHYGRWAYDPALGWYWVPGTHWAPAWVSWRRGGDHVGWAPLPPEGDGYAISIEIGNPEPPPGYWVFVPVRRFTAPDLTVVIVPRDQITVVYRETEPVGPVVVQNNVVVNTAIDLDFIQKNSDAEVQTVAVQEVSDPTQAAQSDAPVAFTGEISAQQDAKPAEAAEATQLKAPTAGQEGVSEQPAEGKAPAGTEQAPADQKQAPATQQQAPAETLAPAEQKKAPAEEKAPAAEQAPADQTKQAPATEQKAPAQTLAPAEQKKAPATEQKAPTEEQAPTDQKQAPATEQKAPAETQAPAEQKKAPAEEKAPAAEQQAPADQKQAPAEEQKAPNAEKQQKPKAEEAPRQKQGDKCSTEDKQAGRC